MKSIINGFDTVLVIYLIGITDLNFEEYFIQIGDFIVLRFVIFDGSLSFIMYRLI